MLRKWGLFLFTLAVGLFLAVQASVPPAPNGADAPLDQFSSARAMTDVRVIAAAPHPTGSDENAKVRAYLVERLTELGMSVSISEGIIEGRPLERLNRWSGDSKTNQPIFNVIGVLPGNDPSKKAVLLMAHHDTVWGSPGAADDTAGIAAILEITRAIKNIENRQRDLIILFTDAEEVGLSGAVQFFKSNPLSDTVGSIINFEARGGGGTANMFQTSAQNGNAARLYAKSVKDPSASSLSIFVYNILPNDTDLTPALEKDNVAYNIANIGRAEYYHSPAITADALSESTLQHMGSQGLDLARTLITADSLPAKKPDATFFDLFGFFTIIYAPVWGWAFIFIAAIGYALSVRKDTDVREIGMGALKMFGFLVIGGVALYGLNIISGSNSDPNYYDRLAAIRKLEATALLASLAVFFAIFGRKLLSKNERLGIAIPFFVLGILGQIFAPTATYFISLALILMATASLALSRWPDTLSGSSAACVCAAIVSGYMMFLGHFLMLGVGPNMLFIAILPAAIAALAILPIFPDMAKETNNRLAVAAAFISLAIALWVRLDPIASTVPLY